VGGAPIGSAVVVNGVATLTHTTAAGLRTQISAEYSGDADFSASSASTAAANPVITAAITSANAKTAYGWYNSAVTVTFTCTAPGAPLTAACPDAVTLTQDGAAQMISRTIYATDGGVASVTVAVNIDQVPPTVDITGVVRGGFFTGLPPVAGCIGTDALSGLATCKIAVTFHKSGYYTYTATARDKAGNAAKLQTETAPAP
jgi:hypothetical protein